MSVKEFAIGSWTLCRTGTDNEPKISDLELARALGYGSNPIEIRKRIRRYITQKILNDVEVIATVAKTSGGRPGKMYMLNEQQALFVAARCETEIADEILKEMIHVFTLARRGMLPDQQGHQQLDMVAIGEVIAKAVAEGVAAANVVLVEGIRMLMVTHREEVQKTIEGSLKTHIQATHSEKYTIGTGGAFVLCDKMQAIANIYAPDDPKRRKKILSGLHSNLRAALGFAGTGRNWCHLPQDKLQDARARLEEEYRAALRQCKEAGVEPPKPKPGAVQMAFNWPEPAPKKGNSHADA